MAVQWTQERIRSPLILILDLALNLVLNLSLQQGSLTLKGSKNILTGGPDHFSASVEFPTPPEYGKQSVHSQG